MNADSTGMTKINEREPFWIKGFNTVIVYDDFDSTELHIEVSSQAFEQGLARWSSIPRNIEPWIDPNPELAL